MTENKPRGPSERQRDLWALSGVLVPKVGDEGFWAPLTSEANFPIRVVRVSATGNMIWCRFLPWSIYQGQTWPFRHDGGLYYARAPGSELWLRARFR